MHVKISKATSKKIINRVYNIQTSTSKKNRVREETSLITQNDDKKGRKSQHVGQV